jgi:hypothetical protein rflaF_19848
MLKKILSGDSCAKCRLCCVFDKDDIWETPIFTEEIRQRIQSVKPDTKFVPKDGGYTFLTKELKNDELFSCPALTENGCMLGDDKPFDCRIWPYRIMEIGGKRAIAVASICEEMYNRPLSQLTEFLKKDLAETIFRYADSHPEIVKPYCSGYPVLLFEE